MSISTCPKCSEKVTVPEGGAPESRVRCPLCQEEYLLGEALDKLPPTLILLDGPVAKPSTYIPFAGAAPAAAYAAGPSPFATADTGGLGAMDTMEGAGHSGYEPDLAEIPNAYHSPAEESFGTAAAETDMGLEPVGGEASFGTETAVAEDELQPIEEEAAAPTKLKPSKAKKKKQKSPIMSMVGIGVGGVVGIALALVFLLWLPINPFTWKKPTNDQRDPIGLGPKIAQYAPFLVPAEYREELERAATKKAEKAEKGKGAKVAAKQKSEQPADSGMPKFPGNVQTPDVGVGAPKEPTEPNPATEPLKPLVPDFGVKPEVPAPSIDPPVAEPKVEKPAVPVAAKPIVRNAPALEEDALEQSKESLQAAVETWANSTNATREERIAAASGFFESLSKLGETATYLSSAKQLKPAQAAQVRGLAEGIVAGPKNAGAINLFVGPWLDNANRGNAGVAMLGTVKSVSPQGSLFLTELELSTKDKRLVTVVSPTAPAFTEDQKIMVLGLVVENPADTLEGYDGPSKPVVFSSVAFAPKAE